MPQDNCNFDISALSATLQDLSKITLINSRDPSVFPDQGNKYQSLATESAVLNQLIENLTLMETFQEEIIPREIICSLIEASCLIPFLESKINSDCIYFETGRKNEIIKLSLKLLKKLKAFAPFFFDILPSEVKILFNLWTSIDDGSIFNKFPDINRIDANRGYINLWDRRNPDSDHPRDLLYSLFKTTFDKKCSKGKISQVIYYENEKLLARFESCKQRFSTSGIPTDEKLMFHGTTSDPQSIFEHGFLMSHVKRTARGFGIYFADYAATSIGYGAQSGSKTLIMARVLVGQTVYNSGGVIVIDIEDQLLPIFQVDVYFD